MMHIIIDQDVIKHNLMTNIMIHSSGVYELAEADGVGRGTKITIHLKDDCKRFALKTTVEGEF